MPDYARTQVMMSLYLIGQHADHDPSAGVPDPTDGSAGQTGTEGAGHTGGRRGCRRDHEVQVPWLLCDGFFFISPFYYKNCLVFSILSSCKMLFW